MKIPAVAVLVFSLTAGSLLLPGQPLVLNPLGRANNGWRIFNVTGSFGYSTLALPTNTALFGFALERLQSDYDATAGATVGYNYAAPKTVVSLFYAPSYVRRIRYSQIKTFNQTLGFNLSRELAPKWTANLSFNGADQTLDQLLFSPAILSGATSPVGTVDDLLAALRTGQYTSDQLASLLTGTPAISTPAQSVIFGMGVLTLNAVGGLSYRPTQRLSLSVNGGVLQAQTRGRGGDPQAQSNFLIPRTFSELGQASANYSWSPRTSVGAQVNAARIDSSFNRYVLYNFQGFLQRKLTPRWFAGLQAGAGSATSLQKQGQRGPLNNAVIATGTASLGYASFEHTLTVAYSRNVSDNFGFASQTNDSIAGSWQWSRPGSSWSFVANGGQQQLRGGFIQDLSFWFASANLNKALTNQLAISFSVGYVDRPPTGSNVFNTTMIGLSGYSTRVTLIWIPGGRAPGENLLNNPTAAPGAVNRSTPLR